MQTIKVRLVNKGRGKPQGVNVDPYIYPQCSNCVWWDTRDSEWGWCDLAESGDGKPLQVTKAYARDMEMYCASLITAKDFGCIQFEQGE